MALSREEIARAKFTFSIYDFDGTNKIDAFQLGNALRALNLCPSLKRISHLGGTIRRNEKMLNVDEFLAIYQEAKKDKQEGTYEEYLEVLAGYDKDQSGKISISTLMHLLQGYGEERLPRDEAEEVIEECGKPDDESMVDYKKFLKNLISGPELKIPIALLRATETEADSGRDSPTLSELSKPPSLSAEGIAGKAHLSAEESEKHYKTEKSLSGDNEIDIRATPEKHYQQQEEDLPLSPDSRNSAILKEKELSLSQHISQESTLDKISSEDTDISSARSSRKSTGKRAVKEKKEGSPDVSLTSDTSGGDLTSARSSLKSGRSRNSTKTQDGKDEASVKAKFQQPMISLKTEGLFGKKK